MQGKYPAVHILSMGGAVLALAGLIAVTARAETWRWTDAAGVVHFADDHDRIPSRYRQKATVVDENVPVNILPSSRAPERAVAPPAAAGEERAAPEKRAVSEGGAVGADRAPGVNKSKKGRKSGHGEPGARKSKRVIGVVPVPTTPARDAQNRAEERIREDRRAIDDAQLPARRAQDQAEEQIRKAREKTMGH